MSEAPFTAKRIELSGGPVHYREAGEGEPLVFVHGFGANWRLWEETARALAGSHRCIVPDWPMGSHSEAVHADTDVTPPGVARMVSEFLAELNLDDVTIVGNDSGGAVSQILVTEHPERIARLVLTNCDCFEKFPPGRFKVLFKAAQLPGGGAVLANSLGLSFVRHGPLAYGALTAGRADDELLRSFVDPFRKDLEVRRDGMKFAAGANPQLTLTAAKKLRALRIPVLLAWGADDRFFTLADARRLREAIPDCRLIEIDGGRTFVSLDRPDRVAAEIAGFVAERPVGVRAG
jgi:pimeloyl-ACP methyl ester carboxylesterase